MTDCHVGYIVVLDNDICGDHAQAVIDALKMIRHVESVEPIISTIDHHIAASRIRVETGTKFLDYYRSIIGIEDPKNQPKSPS